MSKHTYEGNHAKEYMIADQEFSDVTRAVLKSLIPKHEMAGKKVLDLGAGYGRDMLYLLEYGANVIGADYSETQLKLANEENKIPKKQLIKCTMEDLRIENESIDFVFSRYAIQHSYDTRKVFSEVTRVLKPNGKFLFLAVHPIRQFMEKKTKNYWKQENIESNILGGKTIVSEPSHIMAEYSGAWLNNYKILRILEEEDPGAVHPFKDWKYPDILIMYLEKR